MKKNYLNLRNQDYFKYFCIIIIGSTLCWKLDEILHFSQILFDSQKKMSMIGKEVFVRKNLGEVLLAPGVENDVRAVFNLNKMTHGISGVYLLSEKSCTCAGRLPERVEVPVTGSVSIELKPRISFQNEITYHSWRAKYVPLVNKNLPSLIILLEARLIPRIQYSIRSGHMGPVIPVSAKAPRFELDIITARPKIDPEKDGYVQLAVQDSKGQTSVKPIDVSEFHEDSLIGTALLRSRFSVEPVINNTSGFGTQTQIRLIAKVGSVPELVIPVSVVSESDFTISPGKVFLHREKGSTLAGDIAIRCKTPFAIEKLRCSFEDVTLILDDKQMSVYHRVTIQLPLNVSRRQRSDASEIVLKGELTIWTTNKEHEPLTVPIFAMPFGIKSE